jgi:ATP-binding cassette subfamily B protein
MRQIKVFAVFMPIIELLGSIAIAIVIFYGGRGVLSETITLGALVAFISYMKMFFRPIRDIAEKYNVMQNAMASAERLFLILDTRNTFVQPVADSKPGSRFGFSDGENISELEMNEVFFGYVKGEPVLRGISFKVRAGESIAVVGPTGAGKTSLINLIPRFYDPTAGRVLINGKNIQDYDVTDLRSKMALVMQDPFLFSETIRENILHGNSELTENDLTRVVRASNCEDLIERLPQGLNTVLSEGGASVSSGERQLISIARAFARNPDLILLDEATSYIDSETEQRIQAALLNLMKNRTSIIIAHRLSTARIADVIIVMNRGRIIEQGSHNELMTKRGFYFKLNQLQNSGWLG